jgi:DNA-binding transcriptional regulator YdaS (Cro superfamily)
MNKKDALTRAIRCAGSQTALAAEIRKHMPGSRVRQGHIGNWLRKNKVLPPQYAPVIEKITRKQVMRSEWAPNCYID